MRLSVLVLAGLLAAAPCAVAAQTQPILSGFTRIHDPSVIEVDGKYVAFGTGAEGGVYRGAILLRTSPDGLSWSDAGAVGKGVPKWVRGVLGFQPKNLWAPQISMHGGNAYLYYSASVFGLNASAIGLAINRHFDPERPGEGWEDQGVVVSTNIKSDHNAIDSFRIDTADGRAWLSFGSYWDGIRLVEIDPESGKTIAGREQLYKLASRQGAGVEASSLIEHDGYFYLFVSFDQCCKGVASTYRIMVGRSRDITGPYVDAAGKPMMEGGGTQLQAGQGRFIGPGGQEPVSTSRGEMLAYHYYDGEDLGVSRLQLSPLRWSADGWPMLDPLP